MSSKIISIKCDKSHNMKPSAGFERCNIGGNYITVVYHCDKCDEGKMVVIYNIIIYLYKYIIMGFVLVNMSEFLYYICIFDSFIYIYLYLLKF